LAAAALKSDTETWVLLNWADIGTPPEETPLDYTGSGISQISFAPDGSLLVISNDMKLPDKPPEGQGDGPQVQSGGPQTDGNIPQSESNGTQVQGGGDLQAQGGSQTQEDGGKAAFRSIDDLSSTATWFNADGTVAGSFKIKGMIEDAAALNNKQTAVLERRTSITIYDEKGNSVSGITATDVDSIAVSGETLVAMSRDKLMQYDVKSGEKLNTADINTNSAARVAVGYDGIAYIMDNNGLYAVKPTDSQPTKLMDAIGTLVGDPSNGLTSMAVMKDGTVVMLIMEGGGSLGGGKSVRIGDAESSTLAAYRYTDTANMTAKQDFTITSLYDSAKLRKVVNDFQRLHPELNVKLQTQLDKNDESPVEDRIRTLNTDLLAGKGGDVLFLDGLPVEKYVHRGILRDLTDLLKDIVFLPGIREGAAYADGKLYAMPAQFSVELLWGSASTTNAIKTLQDLPSLPISAGQSLLHPRTYDELLRMFYPASESQFRNESGQVQFDSPDFTSFLETIYQIYINQGDVPEDRLPPDKGGMVPDEIIAMVNGSSVLFPASFLSLMQLNIAYTISGGEESGFLPVPSLSGTGYGYTPSLIAGINANSPNQKLAEEFVLSLYSPDILELDQMEGLPTVAASLDKQFEDALTRSQGGKKMMMAFSIDGSNPIHLTQPDEAVLNTLRTLCDTLNQPVYTDETLIGFIVEETEPWFAGSITAQDAAQAVQQRAWAYLNE
jgi:ABC-type glycerol-3-phosphate transport system substrate-binding protein